MRAKSLRVVFIAFAPLFLFLWALALVNWYLAAVAIGLTALVSAGLLAYGTVFGLVVPFRESAGQGLLTLFVPCYYLYYAATRWSTMRGSFLTLLGGMLLGGWTGGATALLVYRSLPNAVPQAADSVANAGPEAEASDGAPAEVADDDAPQGLVRVTPRQLLAAQKSSEGMDRWQGSPLEVAGDVDLIVNYGRAGGALYLRVDSQAMGAAALLERQEPEPWARVAPGQGVVLRGAADRFGNWTWRLHKQDPNPAVIMTARELADEFLQDPQESLERYEDQTVILSGIVKAVTLPEGAGPPSLVLEGNDRLQIDCVCMGSESDAVEQIRAGDEIRVAAVGDRFFGGTLDGDTIPFTTFPIAGRFPVPGVEYASRVPSLRERLLLRYQRLRDLPAKFSVTIADYEAAYELDRKAAEEKYRSGRLEVIGTVKSFDSLHWGMLDFGEGHHIMRADLLTVEPWRCAAPGQTIHLRCVMHDHDYFSFVDGILVEPLPEPPPQSTAAELCAEVLADPEGFGERRRGEWLVVTGTLDALMPEQTRIRLAGAEGVSLVLQVEEPYSKGATAHHWRTIAEHVPGASLTLLARFEEYAADAKELRFDRAWNRTPDE